MGAEVRGQDSGRKTRNGNGNIILIINLMIIAIMMIMKIIMIMITTIEE